MARVNDSRFVREEYRAATGLAARSAIYRYLEPGALDARRIAFEAVTAIAAAVSNPCAYCELESSRSSRAGTNDGRLRVMVSHTTATST